MSLHFEDEIKVRLLLAFVQEQLVGKLVVTRSYDGEAVL